MLDLDILIGNYKDLDLDYYDFLLKKLENGIVYKNLNHKIDNGTYPISIIKNSFIYFHSNEQKGIFGKGIKKFHYNPYFKDDIVEIETNGLLTKIKIIKKSETRTRLEPYIFLDSNKKIEKIKNDFIKNILSFDKQKTNIKEFVFLKKFGLFKESDFQLKPNKISKGYINNDNFETIISKFVKDLNKTSGFPIEFKTINGLNLFYSDSFDINDPSILSKSELEMISNLESNKRFWGNDIVDYNNYLFNIEKEFNL